MKNVSVNQTFRGHFVYLLQNVEYLLPVEFRRTYVFRPSVSEEKSNCKKLMTDGRLYVFRAPGLTSGLQGSVNVYRGALLLVSQ